MMMMIKSVAALLVLAAAGAMSSAVAQDSTTKPGVTGTVQSIDPGTRTLVLEDGRTYHMRKDADMSTLSKGAAVALACDTGVDNCMVIASGPPNDVTPESQSPSAGNDAGAGD
jgi:uncharacterized protein DUF1344